MRGLRHPGTAGRGLHWAAWRRCVTLFGISVPGLATLGCGESPPRASDVPSVVARDSAGVEIVINAGLDIADSTALRIDSANIVSIGELEGEEPYLFGRVVGAVRQPDGRILVADSNTEDIRVFDSDGVFLDRFGGPGEGPGEFTNLRGLQRVFGDSLLATDWEGVRMNVLGPEGEWVRARISRELPVTRGVQTSIEALFGDGTAVAREYIRGCPYPQLEGVMCADTARFHRVGSEGEEVAEFGAFPSRRSILLRTGLPTDVLVGRLAWGQPFRFSDDEHFYHADGERFEARVYGLNGSLDRIIRVDTPLVDADPSDFRPAPGAGPMEGFSGALKDAYLAADFPEHLPQISDLWVDRVGRIWLREWVVHTAQGAPPRWFIFSSDGRLQYSLRLPLYRIHEIGEDYILGSSDDALGVPRVQLFPLRRPGG